MSDEDQTPAQHCAAAWARGERLLMAQAGALHSVVFDSCDDVPSDEQIAAVARKLDLTIDRARDLVTEVLS